jgi:hypothetical protein
MPSTNRRGVEVVEHRTKKVVKFIDCEGKSLDQILKVERGVNINLNHDDYYTRLVVEGAKTDA